MFVFRFLQSAKIWQKLSIIALVLAVPLVALTVLYLQGAREQVQAINKEVAGLEYLEALYPVVEYVPQHRGMSNAFLRGDASFKDAILARQKDLDRAVTAMDAIDARLGPRFDNDDRWPKIRSTWSELKAQVFMLEPGDSFERHTRLMNDVLALVNHVTEKSGLSVDPVATNGYLLDNFCRQTPALTEYLGQLRGFSNGLAAKKEVTRDERTRVITFVGQVKAARTQVDTNISAAMARDASLEEAFTEKQKAGSKSIDAFLVLIDKGFIQPPPDAETGKATVAIVPNAVWESGTEAIGASFTMSNAGVPAIRADLARRARAENLQLIVVSVVLTLAILAAGFLVVMIARGVTRQVNALMTMFSQVGMGDFNARAVVSTSDELGTVTSSLNAMLDNTLALIQTREEKEEMQGAVMKLLEEVAGVADGDLTKQAEVTADMTGAIADSFNHMIEQLRKVIGNVQNATLQVSTSATQIQATAENVAQGAETQTEQIVSTSAAIDEMAVSIKQVSDNSQVAATVAKEALSNAVKGNDAVHDTMEGMNRIRDQVQETAKRIKRLGETTQEIGQIIQLIDDIADRTSILALNAAIQAAAAGEAGRGFAVVAGEVERLAERSTEATKKIATLVKSIQGETNEAVAAMEKSINEVVDGSKLANQAGAALQEIQSVAKQLAELIQSISLAANQQARGSEALAAAMGDISTITQKTSAGTKQAAESVSQLAELADTLRDSVSTFKLPHESNGNGHHGNGNGNGHKGNGHDARIPALAGR